MYGYIYKTTNLINGKIYIGQHKSELFDESYYGSGRYLRNAINKYGIDKFSVEIIDTAQDKSILNLLEKKWIRFYRKRGCAMYNIANGGEGGDVFSGLSDEDKQRRNDKLRKNSYFATLSLEESSEMHKRAWETRRNNGNDKFSEEYRRKISDGHKGHIVSEKTRQKLSQMNLGKKLSEEHKEKIRQANLGKQHNMTERGRKSISERAKLQTGEKNPFFGKTHTDETKKKIGSYNSERFKNKVWINNGISNKRVNKDVLQQYLLKGFKVGRIGWKHE